MINETIKALPDGKTLLYLDGKQMPTNFNHTGYPKGHPIRVELERREASGCGVETNITFDGVDADEYVRSIRDGTYEPDHLVQAPEMVRDCSTCRHLENHACTKSKFDDWVREWCGQENNYEFWEAKDDE